MTHCKNCGTPEDQFDDRVDDEWPDGKPQAEVNDELRDEGKLPYCSIGCMREKLGIY